MPLSIGSNPTLTTTLCVTGYIQSAVAESVWYRGQFEHSGSVATLEGWFDPARLRDDHVPTGLKGPA